MIIYDLHCENAHGFEGWFGSVDDFSQQVAAGMLHCPECDSTKIRRVPSAVALGRSRSKTVKPSCDEDAQHATTHAELPAHKDSLDSTKAHANIEALRNTEVSPLTLLRQLSNFVRANTEDVGKNFATEARRMHYEEIPERSISGHASRDECDELESEGIAVISLPMLDKEDLN